MNTRSIFRGLTMALAVLALPATALAADGFARSSGTLRAGAGSDYPSIQRVAGGTPLDVIGCITRYSWCDVAVDGERGWFPGSRIGFFQDGRRVYLSEGAAIVGLTIVTFGMGDYWGAHYSNRPWYHERRWWRGHGQMPPRRTIGPTPGGGDHQAKPPGGGPGPVIHPKPGIHKTPVIHKKPVIQPKPVIRKKPVLHRTPARRVDPQFKGVRHQGATQTRRAPQLRTPQKRPPQANAPSGR